MSIDLTRMPKLGFGCMRFPEDKGVIRFEEVCDMVDAYLASGLNYFDTAFMYHGGKSETTLREALVKRHPRESFTITDKLPEWMIEGGKPGRDRIFETQLERTGAGYFDFYLLHSVEDGNYAEYLKLDCFEWLKKKQADGMVKHIGFSYHGTPELLDRILTDHPEIEVVQIQLNYLDWTNPRVQSGGLYEVLRKHNKPILIMEPVKGGTLANVPDDVRAMFEAARPGASPASWALRFAASLPGVMTVLSGMSSAEQMRDNLRTFTGFEPLTDAEKALTDRAREMLLAGNAIGCTACRYCVDGCPMGIAIPDVFKALTPMRLYGEHDGPIEAYRALTSGGSGKASDCLACGQCESVCPQHLPIISLMKEAAEKLEK